MKLYSLFPRTVLAVACIFSLAEVSRAAEYFWKVGSGTWDTTSLNWTVGSNPTLVAWTTNNNATLSSSSTATSTITLATDPAVPVMNVTSGSWVVVGGGRGFSHSTSPARIFNITGAGTIFSLGGTGGGNGMIGGIVTVGPGATLITTSNNVFGYGDGTRVTSLTVDGGTFRNTTGDNGWGVAHTWKNGAVIDLAGGRFALGNGSKITTSGDTTVIAKGAGQFHLRETEGALAHPDRMTPFDVANGAAAIDLQVEVKMVGGTGIKKLGAGTMRLTNGTSDYSGATEVNAGVLELFGAGNLTGTSGVAIASGAELRFMDSAGTTFGKVISGAGSVTKAGTGTLTLSVANTYTGVTTVNGGVLELAASSGGAGTIRGSVVVNNGGTLLSSVGNSLGYDGNRVTSITVNEGGKVTHASAGDFGWGVTYNLTGAEMSATNTGGQFSMGNGTFVNTHGSAITSVIDGNLVLRENNVGNKVVFTVADGAAVTDLLVKSVISTNSGAGLEKAGAGTMTLTGANTYTGVTTISGGTLELSGVGNITSSSAIINNAALKVSSNFIQTSQVISGTGSLEKAGTGVLALSGINTYTGATIISGGALVLMPTGRIASSSGVNMTAAGTLFEMVTGNQNIKTLDGVAGTTVNIGSKVLGLTAANGIFAGSITGVGGSLSVTGTETLTGSSSYNGATSIAADSTLILSGPGAALTGTSSIALSTGTSTLIVDNDTTTIAASISGEGHLSKTGGGVLTLTGTNSYAGGTSLLGGMIVATKSGALGTGVADFNGGNLQLNDGVTLANAATLTAASSVISVLGGIATYAGTISGPGGFDKQGDGTLRLAGANLYTGDTTISGGVLLAGAGSNVLGTGMIKFNGGSLALEDGAILANSLATDQTLPAVVNVLSGVGLINGVISGANGLTKIGPGILALGAENTYSGMTDVLAGGISLNIANAIATSSAVNLAEGTTLSTNGTSQLINNLSTAMGSTINLGGGGGELTLNNIVNTTIAGSFQGSGNLIKTGAADLTIDASGTIAPGTISVKEGALLIGSSSLYSQSNLVASAIVVDSGATLGGFGAVTGEVTNNGTISAGGAYPGSIEAGNFTIHGNLTNAAGATILLAGQTPGNSLTVHGNYSGSTSIVLNIKLGADNSPGDRLIIDGGTLSGNTVLDIRNFGGLGDATNRGIPVVLFENGARNAGGTVSLLNSSVIVGTFSYSLFETAEGWFLHSFQDPNLAYRPETASYFGNEWATAESMVMTMRDRMGNAQSTQRLDDSNFTAWFRLKSTSTSRDASNGLMSYESDGVLVQFGADLINQEVFTDKDITHFGLMVGLLNASSKGKAKGFTENASGDASGTTFGPYFSWFQDEKSSKGFYVDSWLLYGSFDNSISGGILGNEDYSSTGLSASVEVGYTHPLSERAFIEPQVQLIFQQMDAGELSDLTSTVLSADGSSGVTGRLGARASLQRPISSKVTVQPYAEANLWFNTMQQTLEFQGIPVKMDSPGVTLDARLGFQAYWGTQRSWAFWLEGGLFSASDFSSSQLSSGLRFNW